MPYASVDFDSKLIKGSVTHSIKNNSSSTEFILDTKYLSIESVKDQNDNLLDFISSSENTFIKKVPNIL